MANTSDLEKIAPKSRSVAVHLYWPDTELRPDRKYANDWTDVLVTKDMSLGPCHPTSVCPKLGCLEIYLSLIL